MATAVDALYEALAPLKLYALEQDSLVDKELAAYGAGFSLVEELLADIEAQAFIHTTTGESLARHEQLVGLVPQPGSDLETRRSLVLYRLGVAPHDYTLSGLTSSIRAAGMEALITELPESESLRVRCERLIDTTMDLERLLDSVESMLPAHLEILFDIGEMTWDMFDSYGAAWTDWNATGI